MPKFTSKPTTIEATQWFPPGDERNVDVAGVQAGYPAFSSTGPYSPVRYYVTTVHGQPTEIAPGDWIITEPDGVHHYPCKPDIFEKRYGPSSPSVPEVVSDSLVVKFNEIIREIEKRVRGKIEPRELANYLGKVVRACTTLIQDRAARVAEAAAKDERIAAMVLMLKEADGKLVLHHDSGIAKFDGECPVCSNNHSERYPNNIFGRIERAIRSASCPPANAGEGRE